MSGQEATVRRPTERTAGMTLDQLADWIACGSLYVPGSVKWQRIRDRAIEALREVAG